MSSFSWATMVMTGTGGLDGNYPSKFSHVETIIVMLLNLIGAFIWTQVLALFCDIATNSNPALIAFRQQLDTLNEFISLNQLPGDMAQRMRSYMHRQKGVRVREQATTSLDHLSRPLQIEVVLHIHQRWINNVGFLRNIDDAAKVKLAMSMTPKVMSPAEVAPNRHLYIVYRGSLIYGARVLVRESWWGDDILLSQSRHFLPYLARAITFADVTCISRKDFYAIMVNYPQTMLRLRRATILLACRREVVYRGKQKLGISAYGSILNKPGPDAPITGSDGAGLIESIHKAVMNANSASAKNSMAIALEILTDTAGAGSATSTSACIGAPGSSTSAASHGHHQTPSQMLPPHEVRELRELLTQLVAGQAKQQADTDHLSRRMQALSEHLGMRSAPSPEPRSGGLFWA